MDEVEKEKLTRERGGKKRKKREWEEKREGGHKRKEKSGRMADPVRIIAASRGGDDLIGPVEE